MANTRSSTSNPGTPEKQSPTQKRKASTASPQSQRGRKQQKTLEETAPNDSDMKAAAAEVEEENEDQALGNNPKDETVEDTADEKEANGHKPTSNNGAIEHSPERAEKIPSTVLEKGLFYFLARPRVNIDDPQSVQDIARTYFVLRPLPHDAKLTEGPLEDLQNNRLLALPKKVMPRSHRDAFMSFVEKGATTIADLKEDFLKGSDYETKTTGVRHTPPVTPLVEGVYAITSTGRTSHLAYVVTLPKDELGKVQTDMGWTSRGSFVVSVKNPEFPGPQNAQLGQPPDFPEEIAEEFRGLRWAPLQPKHLEYANAQFLLIGEGRDELRKAAAEPGKDEKGNKESAEEEVELLEDEDSHRTGQLKGDDSIFADLGVYGEGFPGLKSSW